MLSKATKKGILGYRIFSRAYFYLPFLTIYLWEQGYSIIRVTALMAVYGSAVFAFIHIAKRFDWDTKVMPKYLLIASEALKILGLLLMVLFSEKLFFTVASQLLLGVSYAASAGQDTKLIGFYVDEPGFQEKSNSYMFLSLLFAGMVGSALYKLTPALPFLASGCTSVIAVFFCFMLPQAAVNEQENKRDNDKRKKLSANEHMAICRYALNRAIILTLFTGFLPFYLWIDLNVSMYAFIIILSSYTLMGNIASKYLLKKIAIKWVGTVLDILLLMALILLFSGKAIIISLAALLLGAASGMTRPYCIGQIKREDLQQAVGKMETLYSLLNVGLLVCGGFLYQRYRFEIVLSVCCLLWLLIPIINMYMSSYVKRGEDAHNSVNKQF